MEVSCSGCFGILPFLLHSGENENDFLRPIN